MKEGWEYKKLGEVCERITDGSHNPPKGVACSDNKMLSSQNVRNGYLDLSSLRYLSDEDFQTENKRTNAQQGDVLLTIVGTIGRSCVLTGKEGNITFQRSVAVLKPSEVINSYYLMYCLWSKTELLNKEAQGAAQKGIYLKQLSNVVISYPSLSEQQSIVDYLDSAFAKIDVMKANAEKALNEAKALFQASLKEMLEPKEGWEEKTLKELGQTQTGTTPSKGDKDNYGDYIPFIRPSEIDYDGSGRIEYNSALKLSKKGADNGRVFDAHSIYMVCIGATIGKVGYGERSISCNQQINILTPNSSVNYKFAYYVMKNSDFQQKVIKEGTSSQATLPIINKGKWEKLSISYPPISEQQSIVTTLDSLRSKVDRLQANYEKITRECDALKQAILRQVFE